MTCRMKKEVTCKGKISKPWEKSMVQEPDKIERKEEKTNFFCKPFAKMILVGDIWILILQKERLHGTRRWRRSRAQIVLLLLMIRFFEFMLPREPANPVQSMADTNMTCFIFAPKLLILNSFSFFFLILPCQINKSCQNLSILRLHENV